MADRTRVYDGVYHHLYSFGPDKCIKCPYYATDLSVSCREILLADMFALLDDMKPRLMTASDFEDNPDVDSGGFLPCWIECNKIEVERAIRMGVIQEGETLDGWTEVSMAELIPTDPSYNPNVRHWTARPSEEQRSATPW